jgi:hypothetical protein
MLAIIFAGSLLVCSGVANGQRSGNSTETPQVTWKDAPGRIAVPSASAGAQVVKDADTGRVRQARPGELPEAPIGRATQIINYPDGSAVAIVGDDLMNESVAVKNADGSVSLQHGTDAQTHAEVR